MNHSNGFDAKYQIEQFRQWIGDRDVFLQALPSAAWCIVRSSNVAKFTNALASLQEKQGDGVYFGLNPMKAGTNCTPGDKHIACRQRFILDIDDPDHDLDIPADDVGKQLARATFDQAQTYLKTQGWPAPVQVDSGNGYHGYWYVDLPNDQETTQLIGSLLHALRARFGPLIDTSVGDARRIMRIPGTWNTGGQPSPDRPHRPCMFLEIPELASELVTADMMRHVITDLETAAAKKQSSWTFKAGGNGKPGDDFNRHASWAEILEPHQWKIERQCQKETRWTRPGKERGVSATTGFCKSDKSGDLLFVFSRNAPPFNDGEVYSKFAAFTLLNHAGDFAAAARALAALGYGARTKSPDRIESSPPSNWPAPIPLIQAPPVSTFPLEVFPPPIQSFIEEASNALNVPACYVAGPVLTLAGAAIGNSRQIELNRTHRESALLYWLIVGPPGSLKTPALKLVRKVLDQIQRERMDMWKEEMKVWNNTKQDTHEDRPILERLVVSDTTVETLGLILHENPRGVALIRDEMSALIGSFGQYKMGKGSDKQFFLSVWSGDPVTIDRKTERANRGGPLHINHPFVSLVGGVQPDVLPSIAGEPRRGARPVNDGFLDRFAIVWPDPLPFVGDRGLEVSSAAGNAWDACVRKLFDLEMMLDEHGHLRPSYLQLNPGGKAEWKGFTEQHAAEMNDDLPPRLAGPWSKLKGMTARIALILHLLHWADQGGLEGTIDGRAIHDATKVAAYLKDHARRVHTCMGNDPRLAEARRVASWLVQERLAKVSVRDVYRKFRKLMDNVDEIRAIMRILERHNYVVPCEVEGGRGRQPAPAWLVNPTLAEVEADER